MSELLDRRMMLAMLASASAIGLPAFAADKETSTPKWMNKHMVVVGGGFGGVSAARKLRQLFKNVTLIEPNSTYFACPFSNLVVTGQRPLSAQSFSYDNVKKAGVSVVQDWVDHIDPDTKTVKIRNGSDLTYDRLVLSPGIDFRWNAIQGYDQAASESMPHAWKAGAQTTLLKQQLHAMEDGGTVIISVPPAPFRCPPGPYERASLIAHYLKQNKPRSKLLILDGQDKFSKMGLFQESWDELYGDIIERIPGSDSGQVMRVDTSNMKVFTDFDTFKGNVINVIPPQQAGLIAGSSGMTNASGWCPINATTFESRLRPGIHVIGDATIAAPMPKSAFSANLQGKICALQIALTESGQGPKETVLTNTCYSYFAPNRAFSVSGVYQNGGGAFNSVKNSGGTSPLGAPSGIRAAESLQAIDWFNAITQESFG